MPAVSVIIPNYNHAAFLPQRFESVLAQSHTDFECIILDDASTDNSREVIESYAAKDSRISFYTSDINSGSPFVQWNRGIGLAKHGLVWIAESDDSAAPEFLERLLQLHLKNPAIAIAYCQSNRVNEEGVVTGNWKDHTDALDAKLFADDFVLHGMDYINSFLVFKNIIANASAVLFKKAVFRAVGGADESLLTNSDWLCWLKMLTKNDIAFTAAPLNNFRYHKNSVIAKQHSSKTEQYKEQYDISMRRAFAAWCNKQHIELPPSIKKENNRFISYDKANRGLYLYRHGNKIKALAGILQATFFPRPTLGYLRRLFKPEQ